MTVRSKQPERIWITGASEGLSLAMALQLLSRGCEVAISGRQLPNHDELAAQFPGQLLLLHENLSDAAHAANAQKTLLERWGTLDLLIINAGTCDYLNAAQVKTSLFQSMIESNIQASANSLNLAFALLQKGQAPCVLGVVSSYTAAQVYEPSQPATPENSLLQLFSEARGTLFAHGIDLILAAPQTQKRPVTPVLAMPQAWSAEDAAQSLLERLPQRPHNLVLETLAPNALWPLPRKA